MTERNGVNGLVLAGGRSRRMGSDKALLARDGETQLARAVRVIAPFVEQAFVSVRRDQRDDDERARFAQVVDRYEDLGPVAGILSALDTAPRSAWLVLACDLPNVDDVTLRTLFAGRDASRPFTAFRSTANDLPEPLCAIYEPAARALIAGYVAEGIHCPRKMMLRGGAHLLEQPRADALDNINTPQDLRRTALKAAL